MTTEIIKKTKNFIDASAEVSDFKFSTCFDCYLELNGIANARDLAYGAAIYVKTTLP